MKDTNSELLIIIIVHWEKVNEKKLMQKLKTQRKYTEGEHLKLLKPDLHTLYMATMIMAPEKFP